MSRPMTDEDRKALIEYHMNDVMERIEWERIHKTMVALDWKWARFDAVPTIEQLKADILQRMEKMYKQEFSSNNTGKSCVRNNLLGL